MEPSALPYIILDVETRPKPFYSFIDTSLFIIKSNENECTKLKKVVKGMNPFISNHEIL